jgi:hypothetical protein
MATVFLTVFIVMGFLICFYQDQQQSQPRERDYFYAGSFFVFAIWIALGIRGIIDSIQETKPNIVRAAAPVVLILNTTALKTGFRGIMLITFYRAVHRMLYYLLAVIMILSLSGIFRM